MQETGAEITQLLRSWSDGDAGAEERLFALVYDELRQMAQRCFQRERDEHTLQPTALVHEAYLRLAAGQPLDLQDRNHFFAMAARVMRHILVDHARRRRAEKRGGDAVRLSLEEGDESVREWAADVVAVDDALASLVRIDKTKARIIELRFFGGLAENEAAAALGISLRTVQRHWQLARAWLQRELSRDEPEPDSGP